MTFGGVPEFNGLTRFYRGEALMVHLLTKSMSNQLNIWALSFLLLDEY